MNNDGAWSFSGQLDPGDYSVMVRTLDAGGVVVNRSPALALVVADPPKPIPVPKLGLPRLGPDGALALAGTAEPGATLEVLANGVKLDTATAGADGAWTFDGQLAPGAYSLIVRTLDAGGVVVNESRPAVVQVLAPPVSFELPNEAPASGAIEGQLAPAGQTYIVQDDDWLSKIALLFFGDAAAYSRIIAATNLKAAEDPSFSAVANPDAIEVGWKLWIPTSAWNP